MTLTFEQIYLFHGPPAFEGESEHVWAEMFLNSGHVTVPTPYTDDLEAARQVVVLRNPGVYVDTLDDADSIEHALMYR